MERNKLPDPVIIGQDDQTEIHVQPTLQSAHRYLDIRMWRRNAGGFAPSRTGLTLDRVDLQALRSGIADLLEASDGGQRVARVVWDSENGRRLRGETEPFGTRYVARWGFWQRVRDSWKPVDDGLVMAAERLEPLQEALRRFDTWLNQPDDSSRLAGASSERDILSAWPPPGADWLTTEGDHIAFHPKGVRITCTVTAQDNRHWLAIRQWRREDSLWLPEAVSVSLAISGLEALLSALQRLAATHGDPGVEEEVTGADGSALRASIHAAGSGWVLNIEQRLPSRAGSLLGFEPRFVFPAQYLPRFGRALAQGWFLLMGCLSESERIERQRLEEQESSVAPPPAPEPAPPEKEPQPVPSPRAPAPEVEPPPGSDLPLPAAKPSVFSFGAESETPGTVAPGEGEVRVVVEGFMLPRAITVPLDVLPIVITGLDNLNTLRRQQPKVDPILLCDRPDCAVYGRVGTTIRPDAVELRVWTGPSTSDSISFEAIYLTDLIEGLRQSLRQMSGDAPLMPSGAEVPAVPPAPLPQPSSPARVRPIAPAAPLEGPGRAPAVGSSANQPLSVALGTVTLGHFQVALSVQGRQAQPILALHWDDNTLELPVAHLEELLSDLRALYYDALRGRRGRSLTVGDYPVVTIGVHNQGTQLYTHFQQDVDGEITMLAFPAGEVPSFLNAARAALTTP